jgi:two-component system sensor histidine kinase YesM
MNSHFSPNFNKRLYRQPRSLKKSLTVVLLVSTIIPIVLMGFSSYYVINFILDNKIANGIQSTLQQVKSNVEKAYSNLNYVSQQLTYQDIQLFFQSENLMERYIFGQTMFQNLDFVSFTNPDTGLFYYYTPDTKEIFYQNQQLKDHRSVDTLGILSYFKGVTLYAPHETLAANSDFIFSLSRPINITNRSKMNIYVETNNDLYSRLLNSNQYGVRVIHVLANPSGTVVFSQDEQRFPTQMLMPSDFDNRGYVRMNDMYVFREHSEEQGWTIYTAIHIEDFREEIKGWTVLSLAIAVVSLLISGLLGWSVWKMFYFPLVKLNSEIRKFEGSRSDTDVLQNEEIRLTHITEFDDVLLQFQDMRARIWMLLSELKKNEEDKRYLEVEKLVAQINPHFLYNTLNTVQWLAKTNDQSEIVNLIAIFTRLLRYNLGKNGVLVRLSDEIDALKDYVALQQIRYNYEFSIDIKADPSTLNVQVPRFLLQPLIENALYHGQMEEDSHIWLSITRTAGQSILVQVKDNGKGMSTAQIDKLLNHQISERDKVGMGIGLNYVNMMLRVHGGQESGLRITSSPEQGTNISFELPFKELDLTEGIHD